MLAYTIILVKFLITSQGFKLYRGVYRGRTENTKWGNYCVGGGRALPRGGPRSSWLYGNIIQLIIPPGPRLPTLILRKK